MTIGEKCNNPLNIRYEINNHWLGQTGQLSGFVRFKDQVWGVRAACVLLKNYRKKGVVTVEDIITRWAPPSENDTENYIRFVCSQTGLYRNSKVDNIHFISGVILAMIKMETGMKISSQLVHNMVTSVGV